MRRHIIALCILLTGITIPFACRKAYNPAEPKSNPMVVDMKILVTPEVNVTPALTAVTSDDATTRDGMVTPSSVVAVYCIASGDANDDSGAVPVTNMGTLIQWGAPCSGSVWVSQNADGTVPQGSTYYFTRTLELPEGVQTGLAVLNLGSQADDALRVLVNGQEVWSCTSVLGGNICYDGCETIEVTTSVLNAGSNTVVFEVRDTGGVVSGVNYVLCVTVELPTVTPTVTGTETETLTMTETATGTATSTETPTETPAETDTPTETATETKTPMETPTGTLVPTDTPIPTPTPTFQLFLQVDMAPNPVAPKYTGYIPNTTEIKATVKDGSGTPVPGVVVSFEAVIALGGGHSHTGGRPLGHLSTDACTTNADGQCSSFYTATEFGGTEIVTAYLATQPQVKHDQLLTVRVPDLIFMPGGNYILSGETATHPSNHHGNPSAMADLVAAANHVAEETGEILSINDISLEWGGKFDIHADWDGEHVSHRVGLDVDIENLSLIDDLRKIMPKHHWRFIDEGQLSGVSTKYPHFRWGS